MNNSNIIQIDRFERLQILEFLWKAYRAATTRNPDGTANSPNISKLLKIEQIRVESHLNTLEEQGLVLVDIRTHGGDGLLKLEVME